MADRTTLRVNLEARHAEDQPSERQVNLDHKIANTAIQHVGLR
jgi:hypothetical protein